MFVQSLHLTQFRNYLDQSITFEQPKLILVGDNAQGKSNFLEALQLLATGRSQRANRDRELIQQGSDQGRVLAQVERREGRVELELILRATGHRTARLNGVTQPRIGNLLGQLNTVFFSSWDLDLVRGNPQQRRSWLDGILVQLEPIYAQLSDQYQQVLHQRNSLLKQIPPVPDHELALWDEQLARHGTRVIRRRRRLLTRLAPLATHWQSVISGGNETLQLSYQSRIPDQGDDPLQIEQQFREQLAQKQAAERYQGLSLVGPHRDEVEFILGETPARLYGSQGQQRTLVLALKLAELELLEQVNQQPPLLLLDDVLAELDLKRQNQLLGTIGERVQTFVTTTHLGSFERGWLKSAQVYQVNAGSLQEVS
ncbi:DNA replication/repair protein RecF [Candidatus Cyanaurora vandensis]|uniref:DNA replication/repair protein RecF n=1 Tax=Candidatus Cyanaurora vandensis TaxID=2714958 RepID=UPI00257D6666|nr:DNA replication/repair protein RecF [Candidatus Cyanaurora vandensis]